jgi:transposase
MASANTLCKKLLNVKSAVVIGHNFYTDENGVNRLTIYARPNRWHENDCPICGRRCPRYDHQSAETRRWRALDWGGTLVEIEARTHRIECPEHGVLVAAVPWAYPNSGFTKDFDLTVGWLAVYLPRNAVAEYMRIDWGTVGRCVSRTLHEIEPERAVRLNGLVRIGIDETSYRKGHKYITVIVNHDTNTVVWAAKGHGKSVLERFYRQLTPEQLSTIEVVTGDGAKWITDCVNEFTPDCERCVDPFHVVEWAMDALDEVRRDAWRDAHETARTLAKDNPRGKGRPCKDDPAAKGVKEAKTKANQIKGSGYALGKAPEHLTEKQQVQLEMIAKSDNKLYRAYLMKENLRMLLKIRDPEDAEAALKKWLWWASHSRIPAFKELYLKIKRHKDHILNTIRLGMSNARIEATNNKIKLIIRKAYGFRNIDNMLDMVYLVCSNLRIELPNRNPKPAKV